MVNKFAFIQFWHGPFLVAKGHKAFYNSPFDPQMHQSWDLQGPIQVVEGHQPSTGAGMRGAQRPELLVNLNSQKCVCSGLPPWVAQQIIILLEAFGAMGHSNNDRPVLC